jgi:hypothetical protein
MRKRFKTRAMQAMYEACLTGASDNWSEFYLARTTAGVNATGPNQPRGGAGHRCGYWDGWRGVNSLYARASGTLGYAAWRAGNDARASVDKGASA